MKSLLFTSISNILLLSIIWCIAVFSDCDYAPAKDKRVKCTKINIDADVLNPIYIFK